VPPKEELARHLAELTEEEELELIKRALFFKETLTEAALKREVHLLPYYLLELASSFHAYYNRHRILGTPKMLPRLALVTGLKEVLRLGLSLLGVSAPDRM